MLTIRIQHGRLQDQTFRDKYNTNNDLTYYSRLTDISMPGSRISRYQNVSTLVLRVLEMVVTTGAGSRTELQSNPHHQET